VAVSCDIVLIAERSRHAREDGLVAGDSRAWPPAMSLLKAKEYLSR
jgi:hypothetical protein